MVGKGVAMTFKTIHGVWGRKSASAFLAVAVASAMVPVTAMTVAADTAQAETVQAAAGSVDADNLADGEYTVQISMVNYSNGNPSMSDAAVDHTMHLSVQNGVYTATVSLKGIYLWGQYGYMQHFYYWNGSGFTETSYGGYYDTVDYFNASKLVDDNGNEVTRPAAGTPASDAVAMFSYPSSASFPLLNKAGGDKNGNVLMQVYVPVMESINTGSGTQKVYMSIDWSTLHRQLSDAGNALVSAVNSARSVKQEGSPDTDTAYQSFQAAISSAQSVADNYQSTDDDYNAAAQQLANARSAYEQQVSAWNKAAQTAADPVIQKIDAIGTVTKDSGDAIKEAEDSYAALTVAQKKWVTNYSTLTKARAAYDEILESLKSDDEKAADKVTKQIEALPSSEKLTRNDKAAVQSARSAYNALTDAQLKYVKAETVSHLKAAEDRIAELDKITVATPAVSLSASQYVYTGKARTPSVKVRVNGKKLSAAEYAVAYSAGRKAVGKYRVTVTLRGDYEGRKTVSFKVVPKGTPIKSLKPGKASFKAGWTKRAAVQTSGYQLRYGTSKKALKAKSVNGAGKASTSVKKLKSKKKYVVQIRTYKTVGKVKYYSDWSGFKTVKTK